MRPIPRAARSLLCIAARPGRSDPRAGETVDITGHGAVILDVRQESVQVSANYGLVRNDQREFDSNVHVEARPKVRPSARAMEWRITHTACSPPENIAASTRSLIILELMLSGVTRHPSKNSWRCPGSPSSRSWDLSTR